MKTGTEAVDADTEVVTLAVDLLPGRPLTYLRVAVEPGP